MFNWLASPEVLPVVNTLNAWGQLALGVSLLLGLFVRASTVLGALLMLSYYLALPFPKVDGHSYIVDQHVIYILALLLMSTLDAGKIFGLDKWLNRQKPPAG